MDAVILAGAAAKGAFAAGALSVLLDPRVLAGGLRVRRIVAASSGALNGAFLAAAVRQGALERAGDELTALWLDRADAFRILAPSLAGIARAEGFSSNTRVHSLLRETIRPGLAVAPVDLRIVVTSSMGELHRHEDPPATTFEHVEAFDGGAFDSESALERVFRAVLASSAFPVLFRPSELGIGGAMVPCFDGGLVNNAPIKHAIGDPEIDRVFVISPHPRVAEPRGEALRGVGLLAHLVDILVNERLYRDLREARETNRGLAELEANVSSPALRELILSAVGWRGRRQIEIVEVRPPSALPGGVFDGLFSRPLRASYVEAGRWAALSAIEPF